MDKAGWRRKIKKNCSEAGTYQPYYDNVIDILADIMAKRDDAQDKFEKSGGNTVIRHTNKGGATNVVKNPMLVVIMELNAQALSYWRDLGLTPKGLKALNAEVVKDSNSDGGLERLLEKIL